MSKTATRMIVLTLLATSSTIGRAQATSAAQEEGSLIAILQSPDSSPAEKDAACVELKRTATPDAVPALAVLLTDPELSHSARNVLESAPFPEAGAALMRSVQATTGVLQAGLLHSLAQRHDSKPGPDTLSHLESSDLAVACAAASLLARHGTAADAPALLERLRERDQTLRNAICDAALAIAKRISQAGDKKGAVSIYQVLRAPAFADHVRTAAYVGLVTAMDNADNALEQVITTLVGPSGPEQLAAIQVVPDLTAPAAGRRLSQLLLSLPDSGPKVPLMKAIQMRGWPVAAPAFAELAANSSTPAVRYAALGALGEIGSASVVPTLLTAAASRVQEEKEAARQSLLRIHHGEVAAALTQALGDSNSTVRHEAVRALVARRETQIEGNLLQLAGTGDASTREAALLVLTRIADADDIEPMIEFIAAAGDDDARSQMARALLKVCRRLPGTARETTPESLRHAWQQSSTRVRIALLPIAACYHDQPALEMVRGAKLGGEPELQAAALETMIDAENAQLLPDLIRESKTSTDERQKTKLMRSALRLASDATSAGLSSEQRLHFLSELAPLTSTPEEKWILLAGLGDTPHDAAAETAMPMLQNEETRSEAIQALTKIADKLTTTNPELAARVLQNVKAAQGTQE